MCSQIDSTLPAGQIAAQPSAALRDLGNIVPGVFTPVLTKYSKPFALND
jgi:hypothetical protein